MPKTAPPDRRPARRLTFGENILAFYRKLKIGFPLPAGVEVLNPYADTNAVQACRAFYDKYYGDHRPRRFLFGINPGRRGAGVTGIPFTDPLQLDAVCGIANGFPRVPELSSSFVYEVVRAYGGPASFFGTFYITAVFPLGFLRNGKNMNYYDDGDLLAACRNDLVRHIDHQVAFGAYADACFCIGTGKNLQILESLNADRRWFGRIVPLPHPRWVMQYRRKRMNEFIAVYLDALNGN